jgi:hypothetical protein
MKWTDIKGKYFQELGLYLQYQKLFNLLPNKSIKISSLLNISCIDHVLLLPMDTMEIIKKKGVPSAVGFPHCAGSGEGYL